MFEDVDPKFESILAVNAAAVSTEFRPGFTPIDDGGAAIRRMLHPSWVWVGPRNQLEMNPNWRQLVSYAVVMRGDRVLIARRNSASNETRLRGSLSIGFGGHVSIGDVYPMSPRSSDLCYIDADGADGRAVRRELAEELIFRVAVTSKFVEYERAGVVYDNTSEVSCVHVGLVTWVHLRYPTNGDLEDVGALDRGLSELRWVRRCELPGCMQEFESWSRMIAGYLAEESANPICPMV